MEKNNGSIKENIYAQFGKARCFVDGRKALRIGGNIEECYRNFKSFVLQDGYPCIGAQAAVHRNSISLGVFKKMHAPGTDWEVAYGLMEYLNLMGDRPSNFLTYVAVFPFDTFATEEDFEEGLWFLLNRLHKVDGKNYDWSSEVSNDPMDDNFSFSFAENGFFLVGMHPKSNRKARRFRYPAIAFNFHAQFESLREEGRFETMKTAIRNKERKFDGTINPMLKDFGRGREAPQYSGRRVEDNWKCPFSVKDNN